MACDGRNPEDARVDRPKRRDSHHTQSVDGREGDANAEVRPGELHCDGLWEGGRVVQFDADLGGFTGARRIGMDGDLAFGVGWVGEAVERHRRTVDFANAADHARPFGAVHQRAHVHHRRSVGWQRF